MKNARISGRFLFPLAEAEGFEPPVPCGTPVFKTGAIDQLCQTSLGEANLTHRFQVGRYFVRKSRRPFKTTLLNDNMHYVIYKEERERDDGASPSFLLPCGFQFGTDLQQLVVLAGSCVDVAQGTHRFQVVRRRRVRSFQERHGRAEQRLGIVFGFLLGR
jgi:hypothetical protein